jgi:hypothetical protein
MGPTIGFWSNLTCINMSGFGFNYVTDYFYKRYACGAELTTRITATRSSKLKNSSRSSPIREEDNRWYPMI